MGCSKTPCADFGRNRHALGRIAFRLLGLHSRTQFMRQWGFTPYYLNGLRHPRVPLTLGDGTKDSILSRGEARKELSSRLAEINPTKLRKQLKVFIDTRLNVISRVRDAMALAQDKQKEYSDKHGRGNLNVFKVGE